MKVVTAKSMRDGVKTFGLPPSVRKDVGVIPIRMDADLVRDGISSPEAAAFFLPAIRTLRDVAPLIRDAVGRIVQSIDIVGSDRMEKLYHEGLVINVEGHRDAFWDQDRRVINILAPEELSADPDGVLMHEFGHVLHDAMSAEEMAMLEEVHEAGQRASDHPSVDDIDENFAEAFRAYFLGRSHLMLGLTGVINSMHRRAMKAKSLAQFLDGR